MKEHLKILEKVIKSNPKLHNTIKLYSIIGEMRKKQSGSFSFHFHYKLVTTASKRERVK